jgi:hypothetical protein
MGGNHGYIPKLGCSLAMSIICAIEIWLQLNILSYKIYIGLGTMVFFLENVFWGPIGEI